LELEQIKALELRFTSHNVLVILPRLWKDLNLSSVLFGKAFNLDPTVSVLVISPLDSIVLEQFSEYKFPELGLSAVHLKD